MEILIGAGSVVFGMVISYLTFMRNRDKDIQKNVETEVYQKAEVNTKLDHISRGVDSIRVDLKANERQINNVAERVTRVEESSRSAHKRIDKLEGVRKNG